MSDIESLYYIIEGGQALELVQSHIQQVMATDAARATLVKEISDEAKVVGAFMDRRDGRLTSVTFERGQQHPDFTKPRGKHRLSTPKAGTFWAKRFAEQPRITVTGHSFAEIYKIPLVLCYEKHEGGKITAHGSSIIGWPPLNEVGFLYLSKNGPYGLYAPDVEAYVKRQEDEGYKVSGDAAVYKNDSLEGCRLILKEEWELMVAQHKLAAKQKEQDDEHAQD